MSTYIRIEQVKGHETPAKLNAMAAGIASGLDVAMRNAVKLSEGQLNAAIASMSGGDMRLSNAGGRRLAAKGGVKSGGGIGEAIVGPKGKVVLVENDTNPHMIGFGRASKTKTRIVGFDNVFSGYAKSKVSTGYGGKSKSRKLLSINGSVVVAPVRHPGTSGKGLWKHTRDGPLKAALPKVLRLPVARGAMRVWGR